jgi:hypothetical protein
MQGESIELDIFKDDLGPGRLGVYATCVYLVLLVVAVALLMKYSEHSTRTATSSVLQPSLATFEKLQNDYPMILQCSCSQIAVPFAAILELSSPRLHQVREQSDLGKFSATYSQSVLALEEAR